MAERPPGRTFARGAKALSALGVFAAVIAGRQRERAGRALLQTLGL